MAWGIRMEERVASSRWRLYQCEHCHGGVWEGIKGLKDIKTTTGGKKRARGMDILGFKGRDSHWNIIREVDTENQAPLLRKTLHPLTPEIWTRESSFITVEVLPVHSRVRSSRNSNFPISSSLTKSPGIFIHLHTHPLTSTRLYRVRVQGVWVVTFWARDQGISPERYYPWPLQCRDAAGGSRISNPSTSGEIPPSSEEPQQSSPCPHFFLQFPPRREYPRNSKRSNILAKRGGISKGNTPGMAEAFCARGSGDPNWDLGKIIWNDGGVGNARNFVEQLLLWDAKRQNRKQETMKTRRRTALLVKDVGVSVGNPDTGIEILQQPFLRRWVNKIGFLLGGRNRNGGKPIFLSV